MLEEEEITDDTLYNKILELKDKKEELITNMTKSKVKNGVETIVEVILNSIKK